MDQVGQQVNVCLISLLTRVPPTTYTVQNIRRTHKLVSVYTRSPVAQFFFELFRREGAFQSFVVWVEHRVGAQAAVRLRTSPRVRVDDVERRDDEVDGTEL